MKLKIEKCVLGDVCCAVYFENYISPLQWGSRCKRVLDCSRFSEISRCQFVSGCQWLSVHSASKWLSSVLQKPAPLLLLINAFVCCRSVTLVKPMQELDAYISHIRAASHLATWFMQISLGRLGLDRLDRIGEVRTVYAVLFLCLQGSSSGQRHQWSNQRKR